MVNGKKPDDSKGVLLQSLLTCPPLQLEGWIEQNLLAITMDFLWDVKAYCLNYALARPHETRRLSEYTYSIAKVLQQEPLAIPLARWIQGHWAHWNAPAEGIVFFEEALSGFRKFGSELHVAFLLTNLVAVLTECGRFNEAEQAFREAYPIFNALVNDQPYYLIRLLQNYGWLLHNQGKYQQALKMNQKVVALVEKNLQLSSGAVILAEVSVNNCSILGLIGRLAEGEVGLHQARQVAQESDQAVTVARIDMNLGNLYLAQGRMAEALRYLQMARAAFAEQENHMEVGSVLMREASLFRRLGAWRQARSAYAKAHELFQNYNMLPQLGMVLIAYATTCYQSGKAKQAYKFLEDAEAVWQQLGNNMWLATTMLERVTAALVQKDSVTALSVLHHPLPVSDNVMLNARRDLLLADTLQMSGITNPQQVREAYHRVLAYGESEGENWLTRQALAGLGISWLDNDPLVAQKYLLRAIELDNYIRQSLSVEELKASFQAKSNDLYPYLIRLALNQKRPLQALVYTWKAKGSALIELLQTATVEQEQSEEEQQEINQVRQKLAAHRWQLMRSGNVHIPENVRESTNATIQALEKQLFELRLRQNQQYNMNVEELWERPLSLINQMQADILLEYVLCDDEIIGFCVDRMGNCQTERLTDKYTIQDILDDLNLSFQNYITQPASIREQTLLDSESESQSLLEQCYGLLIAPFNILSNIRKILISPCDNLHLLPFPALWNGQKYLAEIYQFDTIPTGGLLALNITSKQALSPPLLIGSSLDTALPGIKNEIHSIGQLFPDSQVYMDEPRMLDQLQELSQAPLILHIATHSLIREDAPIFSALQLTEGALSVEQCYQLPLQGTELVTLSGCTTATGLNTGGTLLAFQTAFFVAGANNVLTTLWPINDEETVAWMKTFYHYLAANLNPAEALYQTQKTMLINPKSSHPAIWAAFRCSRR